MSRTTYVLRDGQLVPKRFAPPQSGVFHAMSDIAPFVAPDGSEITSRSGLREYQLRYGVEQVGNDWTGAEKPAYWDERRALRRERERNR